MASKQHSFKLNLEEPTEKAINVFLTGKPTTFVIIEALTLYMKFEEAREKVIENAINAVAAPKLVNTGNIPKVTNRNSFF